VRQFKLKNMKRVHGVHFAPDGKRLFAVGGEEARVVDFAVWLDLATGENVGRIDEFAECYAVDPALTRYVVAPSPDRGWSRKAAVHWASPTDPKKWHTVKTRPGVVTGLAFDPAGKLLAVSQWRRWGVGPIESVTFDFTVLRIADGSVVARFENTAAARVISFNADATRVAVTGGLDGDPAVECYTVATGTLTSRYLPPATVTRSLVFLGDDRLVFANGRYVYVLPATGGDPLLRFAGHPKQVNALAPAPDGRHILSASHDGTIRIWDLETGGAVKAFDWGIGPVTAVAFAPDGLTCTAAAINGKVIVWDTDE
jgi:WD40 repeat protein